MGEDGRIKEGGDRNGGWRPVDSSGDVSEYGAS